jgi:hypothetical protein
MTDELNPAKTLRVHIGCDVRYNMQYPTPVIFVIEPESRPEQRILSESSLIEPHVPFEKVRDAYGNIVW